MGHNQNYEAVRKLNGRLIDWAVSEINDGCSDDPEKIKAYGEIIDMVKDLSMAESYLCDAEQSKSVVEAMEKAEKEGDQGGYRMGYNPNRNRLGQYSEGRARSRRMGYVDDDLMMPMAGAYADPDGMSRRMGYRSGDSGNGGSGRGGSGRSGYMPMDMGSEDGYDPRYGRSFNRYREAKRHYTETRSDGDRQRMREASNESVTDAMASMREIYDAADPDLKARMKSDLNKMVGEMK